MNDRLKYIKNKYTDELMHKKNVVGTAIGYKEIKGQKTGVLSLVVMVRKKMPLSKLDTRDVIPPEIEGVVTDVRETGEIKAL
jgi:hypothetical protein